jgi:hypothetical protein
VTLTRERAELLRLLNTPGVTNIPVRTRTSGEIQVIAQGPAPENRVTVLFQPGLLYNLLDFAPAAWWKVSRSLLSAVTNRWVVVDQETEAPPVQETVVLTDQDEHIPAPVTAEVGDMLVYDGEEWVTLSPEAAGTVLQSQGPGEIPSFEVLSGSLLPDQTGNDGKFLTTDGNDAAWSDIEGLPALTGQVTTGLSAGNVCYGSGASTWDKARSDGSVIQANVGGVYLGVAGKIVLSGAPILTALFTTAGGAPAHGAQVYLAASSDDGITGAGKLTATPPSAGYLVVCGTCVDNSNYASAKTCLISFTPRPPILL